MLNTIPPTSTSTGSITSSAATNGMDPAAAQDRFLKLLVAQLTNQDPMNPMDNAQMTSQIAQINTVTGIQQLNNTVQAMAEQFASLQVLQGSSLVGRTVLVEGNNLYREGTTTVAKGTFDLPADATNVKVEVTTPGGQVLATIPMGAREAGRQNFEYDAKSYTGALTYRVVAVNGKEPVEATRLMRDKIVSAGAEGGQLALQLEKSGTIGYKNITAIL